MVNREEMNSTLKILNRRKKRRQTKAVTES